MQSLFGGWFGNLTQTIFEPMLQKLLIPLFGEGFFTNFLTAYLTSRPSDIIKSFNDCKLMTKLIAEGISEAIAMQVMKSKGLTGSGYSFIRNTMGDVLTGSEFISGVEKGLGNTVCSILGKFSNNAEKVVDKVKGSTADAAKTAVSAVKNKVNPAVS
jgi:phage-related protein